jgi:phosphopantothenoylcysteine decarboxylase/phosphopantothenate--cysteine ligase
MNTDMGEQMAVQRNEQLLRQDSRYYFLESGVGLLACDRWGKGRMAEPQAILKTLESWLCTGGQQDLNGKHLLISAGGTREYLDPVRFLGNPSTGKMGLALTQAALDRGARVTLVHGPLIGVLPSSKRLKTVAIINAEQMEKALQSEFPLCDWLIMAAAVADVKPSDCATTKLPKSKLPASLPLTSVPDLVAQLTALKKPHQLVIGFAAQTGDIVTPAREKLSRKGLDFIVANTIDQADAGFGTDTNESVILGKAGQQMAIASCSKLVLAHELYNCIKQDS